MKLTTRLAIVFALQALALVYIVADRQWTLASGTLVVLETAPIDPRSLFSGDYVRLRYAVSRLALDGPDAVGGEREFRRRDPVYVLLRRDDPYWRPVSVHANVPAVSPAQVALRGEVIRIGTARDISARTAVEPRYLDVRYGIESYFVPEGEGRAIERPSPGETVSVRVAIDGRGRAAIQALLVNGAERYIERLF